MAILYSTTRRPGDAAVARLYQFAPWARRRKSVDVRKVIRLTPIFLSAWDGRKLVGMARVGTDFTFRAVLWDVIVDPDYAGQGIGSALVRRFLRHPKLKSVESFWLSTTDKQRFYGRFGFKLNSKNIMVYKRAGRGPR